MITFDAVDKIFQTPTGPLHILEQATFTIEAGAFVSIMGPSGTGKTTVLNLIAGLEDASWWSIRVGDTELTTLIYDQRTARRGKHIWFVFQQFYLLPELTVIENIDLVIDMNWLERRFETKDILAKVGLAGKEQSYPEQLSWGEQQRVAVARAFVGKTPFLLADEPTGNLDQKTAREVMDLMKSMHEEVKNTIVMITHDKDTAAYAWTHFTFADKTLQLVW